MNKFAPMKELFIGTGIAHSILLVSVVIATGLYLGRFKVKGVSIGSTWILFLGILLSHFGLRADPTVLSFMKDFGLILFVFSIGIQVGPAFFQSFRAGGVKLNLLAGLLVLLAVLVTVSIHLVTGESLETMVGVMSGAVTNTPGLGAAQQTLSEARLSGGYSPEVAQLDAAALASSYAVAYPLGVLAVIMLMMIFKGVFRIDLKKEKAQLDREDPSASSAARRMHCEVENPAIFGKTVAEVMKGHEGKFVISRIMRNGKISIPGADTLLEQGDKLLLVTSQDQVDELRIVFGEEIPMHLADWVHQDEHLVIKKITVTKPSVNGKMVRELNLRATYGIQITRVNRSGVDLVARPNLILQLGDILQVVGTEASIKEAADAVGNQPARLNKPNLIPIFLGIAIGIIFGSLPIRFPGMPQPVKLGLAGGPLIIAILLGHFGPRWKIITYSTSSANLMMREIGISFFLAAVGLGAGESFVASLLAGGWWWILYGFLITVIPVLTVMLVSRLVFKLNFYQICGLVCGATTDPAALAFAQDAYGTDYPSVNYATVYPLTMFLRVLVAQILILFAVA